MTQFDAFAEIYDEVYRNIKSLTLYYIFKNEMQHLLEKRSFKILNLYGDFNYNSFNEKSERMIWVVEKN